MGIAVYPRLDGLLRERGLTVAELERRIERQFGMTVDPETLYCLTHADPIQRADLEVAGAVAKVLDVRLDDIFDVQATASINPSEDGASLLSPAESRRMSDLLDQQGRTGLSDAERDELNDLVSEQARRIHEIRIREIAQLRGVSAEQAERDVAQELADALKWWAEFEADPENRRRAVAEFRKRRPRESG